MKPKIFYKLLNGGGRCANGGYGTWPLPKDGKPGRWKRVKPPLALCHRGLHVVPFAHIFDWSGAHIYEAECAGRYVSSGGAHPRKYAFENVRLLRQLPWSSRVAWRLFAEYLDRYAPDEVPRTVRDGIRLYRGARAKDGWFRYDGVRRVIGPWSEPRFVGSVVLSRDPVWATRRLRELLAAPTAGTTRTKKPVKSAITAKKKPVKKKPTKKEPC